MFEPCCRQLIDHHRFLAWPFSELPRCAKYAIINNIQLDEHEMGFYLDIFQQIEYIYAKEAITRNRFMSILNYSTRRNQL